MSGHPEFIQKRIESIQAEVGRRLLDRLYWHETLFGKEQERFWDLRVNHVVGDWFRAGKPGIDVIRNCGFGYIEQGSTNLGPAATPEFYNVGLHIEYLAKRGNVTMEEMAAIRMNSYERDHLWPHMNVEALIESAKYCMTQAAPLWRTVPTTYDEALIHRILPQFILRMEGVLAARNAVVVLEREVDL